MVGEPDPPPNEYFVTMIYIHENGQASICVNDQPPPPHESPIIKRYGIGFIPYPQMNEASCLLAYTVGQAEPAVLVCPTEEMYIEESLRIARIGQAHRIEKHLIFAQQH